MNLPQKLHPPNAALIERERRHYLTLPVRPNELLITFALTALVSFSVGVRAAMVIPQIPTAMSLGGKVAADCSKQGGDLARIIQCIVDNCTKACKGDKPKTDKCVADGIRSLPPSQTGDGDPK